MIEVKRQMVRGEPCGNYASAHHLLFTIIMIMCNSQTTFNAHKQCNASRSASSAAAKDATGCSQVLKMGIVFNKMFTRYKSSNENRKKKGEGEGRGVLGT